MQAITRNNSVLAYNFFDEKNTVKLKVKNLQQASVYEACDRTRTPKHTPKTLEMCKKACLV